MTRHLLNPVSSLLLLVACGTTPVDTNPGDTDTDTTDTDTDDTDTDIPATAPVAVDDDLIIDQGDDVTIEPLLNDTDPNGDELDPTSVVVVTEPLHATVEVAPDGRIRYSHDASVDLSDSFTYTVDDMTGETSNTATVTLTINPVNELEFSFTGAEEVFEAPVAGMYTFEVWGAQGSGGNGGLGGYASGELLLGLGDIVNVYVGGKRGFNGGGAGWAADARDGGGASDIRMGGTSLADRILVAGGGGSSSGDLNYRGGHGGGGVCGADYCGGGAGDGYGGPGTDGGLDGGAGDSSFHSGGAGGAGFQSGGFGSCNTGYTNTCGEDGTLGQGGAGDPWENGICFNTYGGTSGGGGGYFGGGGSSTGNCGGGGGGGGSSWVGTMTNPVMTPGVKSGDGGVLISW